MVLDSFLFGSLQGLFEWLPISSTGELVLIMMGFFDFTSEDATRLSFFMHIGTSFAAILYFRSDLYRILRHARTYRPNFYQDNKLLSFLITSTLISGLLGFIVYKLAKGYVFSGEIMIGVIGIALIITGLFQKFSKPKEQKSQSDLGFRDSVLLGVVQAFSAIPGISRSGITVSTFLFKGYSPKDSVRLSFLMGIPAILASQLALLILNGIPNMPANDLVISLLSSFAVGYFSLAFLIRIATKVKFWHFTIIIGVLALFSFVDVL